MIEVIGVIVILVLILNFIASRSDAPDIQALIDRENTIIDYGPDSRLSQYYDEFGRKKNPELWAALEQQKKENGES